LRRYTRALLLCLGLLLAGCYPDLDWRELSSSEGGFKVLMPARPTMASGTDASGRPQTLWTAEAGGSLFSVGYTDYADAAQSHIPAVRDTMLRAARGNLEQEKDIPPPQGPGLSLSMLGSTPDGNPRRLQVWLFARGSRLYQLAVIGKPGAVSTTETDTLFLSFRIN
jgi:hypothetical protein